MDEQTPAAQTAEQIWTELANEREAGEPPSNQASEAQAQKQTTSDEMPSDEPGEAITASPEAEPKEEQAKPDPFAGLSPEVQERLKKLDELTALIPSLQSSVKTAEGRVAAMQREMDVARNAAKAVKGGPSQAQIAAAAGSIEKWDSLKEDFPDWAEATEQFVKHSLAGIAPGAQGIGSEELNALLESRLQATRAEALKAIEEAKVEGKHEDWREVIRTEKFGAWFDEQPEDVKQLAFSDRGRDAIRMLDLFKAGTAKPATQRQDERTARLAAAVGNKPGATGRVSKTVDQMTPQELWDYEARRARERGGRVGLTY